MIGEANVLRNLLFDSGFECTARWILDGLSGDTTETAEGDLADVARADVLVALNPATWKDRGTGGRHVELGYALALKKPVLLLGVRSNVFHYLDGVWLASDVNDLVGQLTDRVFGDRRVG
jgi:nucleoside 2-deoxyribosyltransferase